MIKRFIKVAMVTINITSLMASTFCCASTIESIDTLLELKETIELFEDTAEFTNTT